MHKKSKHHNTLLTIGWIVAVVAIVFVLRQRAQFPHEAFPARGSHNSIIYTKQKKTQPKMPVINTPQP